MASRIYRPKRDDHVTDNREVLIDHAHNVAVNQLIPRIARQNQIAVDTVPSDFYFYSKMRVGRRCSCSDIEVGANSSCRCCFGTMVVGGYEKYGTNLEIFDVTHPSIRSQNVVPDTSRRERPRHFILIDGAVFGHVTTRMYVNTNIGVVDHLFSLNNEPSGTQIEAFLKAPTDTDYVEFTSANLAARLYNPWIDLRVTLRRASVTSPSPRFGLLYIRYRRASDIVITANVPRVMKSDALQEFGVTNDWTPIHLWLPNTLKSVNTEDFFIDIDDQRRWMVTTDNDFSPAHKLLSWELDAQLVQPYQSQYYVPL